MFIDKMNSSDRMKKFDEFVEATSQDINDIGVRRHKMISDAKWVQEQLFKATEGDASKVTKEMIEAEYDKLKQD